MIARKPGRDLTADTELSELFRAWLGGRSPLGSAKADWERFMSATEAAAAAPIWTDAAWLQPWSEQLRVDLPDQSARDRLQENVQLLRSGKAEVVITGQQPGFLGGPLYTLFKIATAIEAAALRTAAGLPTVPLFWAGDDDDDRREALRPMLYDPLRSTLLRGSDQGGPADRMIGAAPAAEWGRAEAIWLRTVAGRSELAAELAELWQSGLKEEMTWGRLHRRAVLRLFRGSDLLVVSGHDSGLHRAAASLYAKLWRRRNELMGPVQQKGVELAQAGYHAQLSEMSLQRFLHLDDGGRRLSLPDDAGDGLPDAARLRPGVAVRSLVQDWLFRPAAVVIGPAELAYLKQLEPLYEVMDVPRSALVPRLFGWLVPEGLAVAEPTGGKAGDTEAVDLAELARGIGASAERELAAALMTGAGVPPDRAAKLAERQLAQWRRAAVDLLARERRRPSSPDREQPAWTSPLGKRQERNMAAHWAAALWGRPLIEAVREAARLHLRQGSRAEWREFRLHVPEIGAGR